MRCIDILIVIGATVLISFAMIKSVRADATPDIPAAPTVDGYPTLASIPMPDNQRVFLTAAPSQCPQGMYYGMLANVETGAQPTWFCWYLDMRRGTIRSQDDDYAVSVEDFNWTGPGRLFLKRQVNL